MKDCGGRRKDLGFQFCDLSVLLPAPGLSSFTPSSRKTLAEPAVGRCQPGILRLRKPAVCPAVSRLGPAELCDGAAARRALPPQPRSADGQRAAESGHPLCVQVHGLPAAESQPAARRFAEAGRPGPAYWHLILHLSGDELRHRRVSRPQKLQPQLPRRAALHLLLPAVDCRAHRPLGRYFRADPRAQLHSRKDLGGDPALYRRPQQEASAGRCRSRRGRRGVLFRHGRLPRCLAGRDLLHAADLFRFLRLQRHGHRYGKDVRILDPRKLPVPLYRVFHS